MEAGYGNNGEGLDGLIGDWSGGYVWVEGWGDMWKGEGDMACGLTSVWWVGEWAGGRTGGRRGVG